MSAVRRATARDVSHTGEVPAPGRWVTGRRLSVGAGQPVLDSNPSSVVLGFCGGLGGGSKCVVGQRQEHADLGKKPSRKRHPAAPRASPDSAPCTGLPCSSAHRSPGWGEALSLPSCSSFLCPMPPHSEGWPAGSGGPSCPSAHVHGHPSRGTGEPSPATASLCPGLCGQDRRAQGGAQGGAVLCLGEHSSEGLFPRWEAQVCDGRGR